MDQLVAHFAQALKAIDESRERHKQFLPGVGPFGEPQLVRRSLEFLRKAYPDFYGNALTKREPDVLIPGKWALEFKIVRPFGDNGKLAEHWSENLLHPYLGNISALGDCLKLQNLKCTERKGVVVITFEHQPPKVELDILIECFELLARGALQVKLGPRHQRSIAKLVHPVHQQATVYGWELQSPTI